MALSIRNFYDKVWGEYADPMHHPVTAQALAAQARAVGRRIRGTGPRRVLDLGCGPVPVVRLHSAPLVLGADLVFDMLVHIKTNRPLPVACLDARMLPFRDRSVDFIWCGLLIDHISDPDGWIEELLRVLAPAGTLGMACWDRSVLPAGRYPENSRMRYTTAQGEELSVPSFPTWEAALRVLKEKDPTMEMESFPIIPDEYVLQIAWVTGNGIDRRDCSP